MKEENAYILGTDTEELHRLGIQHQIWSSEAQMAWKSAGFTAGQTLLDLGCGPGFCTRELAYITGTSGKVFEIFIQMPNRGLYLRNYFSKMISHNLNIKRLKVFKIRICVGPW